MHQFRSRHITKSINQPDGILWGTPGENTDTDQHHRRRIQQPPADNPSGQACKLPPLLAKHLIVPEDFPFQPGLFMARHLGHHLITVAKALLQS